MSWSGVNLKMKLSGMELSLTGCYASAFRSVFSLRGRKLISQYKSKVFLH